MGDVERKVALETPILQGYPTASEPDNQALMSHTPSNETIVTDFANTIFGNEEKDVEVLLLRLKDKYGFTNEDMRNVLRNVDIHKVLCPDDAEDKSGWACFIARGKRCGLLLLAMLVGASELIGLWQTATEDYLRAGIWGPANYALEAEEDEGEDGDDDKSDVEVEVTKWLALTQEPDANRPWIGRS